MSEEKFRIEIPKENEVRFEIPYGNSIVLKLVEGTAEVFGTEMAPNASYTFSGEKIGIFTFHGCVLEMQGLCTYVISGDTQMNTYINIAYNLSELRNSAQASNSYGPNVIVVGPTDSGKSTMCKMLLNYATRKGVHPMYVDLDIGQGSITVPGMLAAAHMQTPISIGQSEPSLLSPLSYFYGQTTPSDNIKLYKLQMANLARDIRAHQDANSSSKYAGCVINTCGWIEGVGYDLILESIKVFQCDIILVTRNEINLFDQLTKQFASNKSMKIIQMPKNTGVAVRDSAFRRKTRMRRVKEYFYGAQNDLSPHTSVMDFKDVFLYKIGQPKPPPTALAIQMVTPHDPLKLMEILPTTELVHCILGVSYAKSPEELLSANLAGYIYISDIQMDRQRIVFTSPSPGILPSKYLLISSIKWTDRD